jgi:hypothetical protein
MQCDVVQTFEVAVEHRRHAFNGLGIEHAVAHDPETAGTLGDEHRAVGEERERIRARQAPHRYDPELRTGNRAAAGPAGGTVEDQRPLGEPVAARNRNLLGGGASGGQHDRHGNCA